MQTYDIKTSAVLPAATLHYDGTTSQHQGETALFVAYHPSFHHIVSSQTKLRVLAVDQHPAQNTYHEAGVWIDARQEFWLTTNLRKHGESSGETYTQVLAVDLSPGSSTQGEPHIRTLDFGSSIPCANGGTIMPDGNVLLCDQGRGTEHPAQLVSVDPVSLSISPVINNYRGRPFNSLNDVVVLPPPPEQTEEHYTIWFTDPSYGYEQGFKPEPVLPNMVYCFKPATGQIRAVADGFTKPNGIVIDEKRGRCYITDSGFIGGTGECDPRRPATIIAYDLIRRDEEGNSVFPFLTNRRVFAQVDCGAADGIKLDTNGNVFAGCFDGVHIWNPEGHLLGKLLLRAGDGEHKTTPLGCANLAFVPGGRLICMAESHLFMVDGLNVEGALVSSSQSTGACANITKSM